MELWLILAGGLALAGSMPAALSAFACGIVFMVVREVVWK